MTKKQKELAKKHGHPLEFGGAVDLACDNLFLTQDEADRAKKRYQGEWDKAGYSPQLSTLKGGKK